MFRRAVAVLTAAAALTSACGDDDTAVGSAVQAAPTSSHSTAADQGAPAGTPEPGAAPDALRFTAPLVGGGAIDLTGYAGQPVLLWFWAPY